ncbi:unnamed protein product [Adineta ricciae]|uniref:G-protein coupled receptors family 1 profile domain-containing protein n=1 Tax=Adineta ricciae TaxID=249248 RepID=A0A815CKT8_ADIRI|nr:unnamed protein product [Adineta ricciae]CAF1285015.1 unnamed protein product [Adineta ricciae]
MTQVFLNNDLFSYLNMSASVSATWHNATGIFASLCLICGAISNALVIYVFLRSSSLRQPRNFLLINLAVADLGLLLTNNILHAIASFNKQWPFGKIGCDFYAFSGGLCAFTSIATMAAIALTRLVAVVQPFSSLKLTTTVTLKCIACCWLYGLILMIAPFFGWSRFVFEGFGTSCTFDYVSKDVWNRVFMLILIVVGFSVPLAIIIVSYAYIVLQLSKRNEHILCRTYRKQKLRLQLNIRPTIYDMMNNHSLFDEVSRNYSMIPLSTSDHQIVRVISYTEARVIRTALLICTTYCMAWTPYAILTVLSQVGFDHLINAHITTMFGLLTKTAACVNPFIYALSSSVFRRHLFQQSESPRYHVSLSENSSNRRNLLVKINE